MNSSSLTNAFDIANVFLILVGLLLVAVALWKSVEVLRACIRRKHIPKISGSCVILVVVIATLFVLGNSISYLLGSDNRWTGVYAVLLSALLFCFSKLLSTVSQRVSVVDAASEIPVIDPLTGAYSRYYIEARLESEIARSRRYSSPLTVLAVNISNIHTVNQVYGFQIGDSIICRVAQGLVTSLRESDVVARYDADRFIIVLAGTPEWNVSSVINRLQRELDALIDSDAFTIETSFNVNVNFGEACCTLSTRRGTDLIEAALNTVQSRKLSLKEQDTISTLPKTVTQKTIGEVA